MNETIMSLQQSSGIIPYRFYVARQDFEDMDLSLRRKYHIIFGSQTISLYPTAFHVCIIQSQYEIQNLSSTTHPQSLQ